MSVIVTDKNSTKLLQGLAILFMIAHHIPVNGFGEGPIVTSYLVRLVLENMKICVPIFTFLIGFGYFFCAHKTYQLSIKRIVRFLSRWGSLLCIIFIPVSIAQGGWEYIDIQNFALNLVGIKETFNWYSWFVYIYIYAMLIIPLFPIIINRKPIIGLVMVTVVSYLIEIMIHSIADWDKNEYLIALFFCMYYTPILAVGYFTAKTNIYKRVARLIPHNYVIILSFILLTGTFGLRMVCSAVKCFSFDIIYVPVFCFAVLLIFSNYKINYLRHILTSLGAASLYMWFLHSLFFCNLTNKYFAPIISWSSSPVVIYIIVVGTSFFMAQICLIAEHRIFKPIVDLIKSVIVYRSYKIYTK